MAMKKCPVCGVSVKVENLQRHVHDQHPRSGVDLDSILTEKEVQEIRRPAGSAPVKMTRRGKILAVVVALVLVGVVAAVIYNASQNVGLKVGQVAPDFTEPTSDGGSVHLYALRGQPVLLEFMDVDCPHCVNEARDVLRPLYLNYSARTTFLSVDVNLVGPQDTVPGINTFRTTYSTPWTYALYDPIVNQAYGITGTPTIYVLDPRGVIVAAYFGETAYATLAAALDRALA